MYKEFEDEFADSEDEKDVLTISLKGHPKLGEKRSEHSQLKYNMMLEEVSRAVMKNIPKQVEQFYADRQIKPLKKHTKQILSHQLTYEVPK